MFRNKVLAKEILQLIAAEDNGGGGLHREEIHGVYDERYPNNEAGRVDALNYHLLLLETAGFVKVTRTDHDEDNFEMTWAGHDFIDAS